MGNPWKKKIKHATGYSEHQGREYTPNDATKRGARNTAAAFGMRWSTSPHHTAPTR